MTSDEIKGKQAIEFSTNGWLREVAYLLALLNEQLAQEKQPPLPPAKTQKVK